ncbi:hypothetical protein O181_108518 [Austropuccinia psidii MF-1]|uniref:Integrase catalytic domain-containing protein n=1 Tax=Austropuccinia psidii MF-1 TaxID=1389203 RepID=A0A9Q3PNX5_9BASI|nr:hypothetical protein [Austropuccinia psidii MF-1]
MDWITALPQGGESIFNSYLALADRYSKNTMFLQFHKDDTTMDTAIMICNRVISHTGLFQNIIIDRDPKFTSELWASLNDLLGANLSFSIAYHSQTDGLAEGMIQTLEEVIRQFCAYGLEFKYSHILDHYWCTLIPALELSDKTSIHSSTGKTPAILEKGLNPRLPDDTLKKDSVDIHPTESTLKVILDKARDHENRCMQYSFKYEK